MLETLHGISSFPLARPGVIRLLCAMARPVSLDDLLNAVPEPARPTVRAFIDLCVARGVVLERDGDGSMPTPAATDRWEFHDLLFHFRSRNHVAGQRIGATFRGQGEPLPGRNPSLPGATPDTGLPTCSLPPADLEALTVSDWTLTRALEQRRSVRTVGPIDVATLGHFLYRTCRVTGHMSHGWPEGLSTKVYPSGGCLHSLRLYLAARACPGLEPALYRYDDSAHALMQVRKMDPLVQQLLLDAARAMGPDQELPAVLFVMTALFQRSFWKYEGLAYRVILLEVGGLYQTMYLVATAMGLAPCAVGTGNSNLFTRLIRSNPREETSVGEFALGAVTS